MRRITGVAMVIGLLVLGAPAGAADEGEGVTSGPLPVDAFARLEPGMGEQQVQALIGPPAAEGLYAPPVQRALSLIGLGGPRRTYFYRGLGRVQFDGGSQLLQNGKIVKVEIDADEPGTRR
jgi:hypothetical protein